MLLLEDKRFYVYAYLKGNKPFYIGKGKENRVLDHVYDYWNNTYFNEKIKKIQDCIIQNTLNIVIIDLFLTEKDAFLLEKNIIDKIGLCNLTNKVSGGKGGDTFKYMTEIEKVEFIKKIGACQRKGKSLEEIYGIDKAKEIRNKASKNSCRFWEGKKIPEDVIKKRQDTRNNNGGYARGEDNYRTGTKRPLKERKKMSENHADFNGEKNPFYNKKHTEETKKKIGSFNRKSYKEKYGEIKAKKIVEKRKRSIGKRKWMNNGVNSSLVKENEIQDHIKNGWQLGRIYLKNQKKRGIL